MTATDANEGPPGWGERRSKAITWYDPMIAAEARATMSGLDHLTAIMNGTLPPPPIASHFGLRIVEVGAAAVTFTCEADESAYNPIGVMHGGLVCTLLDTVIGCAVQSTLPAGTGYTSIELKVNYLRPIHAHTGALRGHGWVTKPGRRVAFADGEVRDGADTLLATGTGSCLILTP